VSAKRDHNRAWVRHARAYGATRVTIWFAPGEYDDATRIEVSIRQALATLAEHVTDFHVDAVGTHDGADVTGYLSEYVEPKAEPKAGAKAEPEAERAPRRTPEEEVELAARIEARYQRHLHRQQGWAQRWLPHEVTETVARVPGRAWDVAAALGTLWFFVFALPATVIGWFAGDWVQGLGVGTLTFIALLALGRTYGEVRTRARRTA
jgi:hypothetical protein